LPIGCGSGRLGGRAEWEGHHNEVLLAAAEILVAGHPVAATILYRALLDDILNLARSSAYGHAARYLEKLDALAAHGDAASSIDPHHASSRCENDRSGPLQHKPDSVKAKMFNFQCFRTLIAELNPLENSILGQCDGVDGARTGIRLD
jgi:hypothetical protein